MSARRESGASGVLLLAVMVLVMVGLIAAYALSRISASGDDRAVTSTRLNAASEALERYAAAQLRLPCPADPAGNTGNEVQASAATCTFTAGTLPWNTIGLLREQGMDAWGRKLAYRVYTGSNTKGSLTQPRGVSMVECDTVEPASEGPTPVAASLGGLCRPQPPDPANLGLRTTTPAEFLDGKGLSLTDSGANFADVAYVVVSHGRSGLGGYTTSGAMVMIDGKTEPGGDEKNNTQATGPFTIRAFSDAETAATAPTHFDDLIVYRRLPALINDRLKLGARNWLPDPLPSNVNVRFDAATIGAAMGTAPPAAGTNLGTAAIGFSGATVSATAGGTATNMVFESSGTTGIGGGGFFNFLSSFENEVLRIDLSQKRGKFAVTLANFGYYEFFGTQFPEQVEFRFYRSSSPVGTFVRSGCSPKLASPPPLASYQITVGADFDSVDIVPLATNFGAYFLVSEFSACVAGAPSCTTTLATPANTCGP